jgi:ABC-type nitrate/sulfonate/bicarbonate transport system permease component
MLFAGIGDTMKVLVIVSGCMWPILINTAEGVRAVDEVLSDTCRSYRITEPSRLRHLVLRSASPQIVTGMRQSLSIAIILMVISEMFAASNGIGFTIVQFQRSFAIPEMWSGRHGPGPAPGRPWPDLAHRIAETWSRPVAARRALAARPRPKQGH